MESGEHADPSTFKAEPEGCRSSALQGSQGDFSGYRSRPERVLGFLFDQWSSSFHMFSLLF